MEAGYGLRIKRLKIENFRGVKEAEIIFPNHCVILGQNNCGKTTIVEAIALTLGREKLVHQIDDYDFHGGFFDECDPLAKRFSIKVVLIGFPNNDPIENSEWFNIQNAGLESWWDNELNQLHSKQPDDLNDYIGVRYFLATELACCGFYDEDNCEFNTIRYFVDGECDPAAGDPHNIVPKKFFKEIGIFLLPSRRMWDKTLTFNASSFIKLLRESNAIPSEIISELRNSFANIEPPPERIGDDTKSPQETDFGKLISSVENGLKNNRLINSSVDTKLLYRPTELDVKSILTNLMPHIKNPDGSRIPISRQGSGLLALQNLLLLIEFAKKRREIGRGLIFLIEEPELHLHPGLQQRIIQVARGYANQVIVTTHSPHVACSYSASEVIVLRKVDGFLTQEPLVPEKIPDKKKNLIKSYFYNDRLAFCGSIMGSSVIVPEGARDAGWLTMIKSLGERYEAETNLKSNIMLNRSPSTFTIIRTKDSQVVDTFQELKRLGCRTIPLVDGDREGQMYVAKLSNFGAQRIIRWNYNVKVENIVAWVIEPCIIDKEKTLKELFETNESLDKLKISQLLLGKFKKQTIIHEHLIAEASEIQQVRERAWELSCDLSTLCEGDNSNGLHLRWTEDPNLKGCFILKSC